MQGRPPTTRLWPRSPARGRLATARASPKGRPAALARGGSRPQGQQSTVAVPTGRSAARRHYQLRPARRGGNRPRARSIAASPHGRQPPAVTAACYTAPAKGANCRVLARGYRLRPALSPGGTAAANEQGQPSPT
ncbi:hypothetical protein GW17_00059623 [Ensete ventricosum]|nr:hypothetical protein GW17_00059623 [Ensete ventricosum]